ncbi:TIGR03808 family TAT-translocated repetitive protein [Notoacmeibacter ruber]|uniref:TIGR03808 family TAT-translocated repetitive protein n=1 Tax=Notoacmeibacter ruber TaxID=2670375 RepID=A0A3L7JAN0_9HYPH|nr:TIGR03808 family TAT-translocated repetitive protein [Notoacmeibacter ruber]RLQ87494.1 TIGR03808 family TAT-translocated repetitive protein [Notoacmeibacter ruber]
MVDRRCFILGLGASALTLSASTIPAGAQGSIITKARLRGGIDATEFGLRPNATDDQSAIFQRMIDEADRRNLPIDLPPGVYPLSNIRLPKRTRLSGVPGATRIRYSGRGFLFRAENAAHITLDGLSIDGQNRWLSDDSEALIELRQPGEVHMTGCEVVGAGKTALQIEGASGLLRDNHISGAASIGLFARQSEGLSIEGNTVERCGDGGILVHRWEEGEDATQIRGNRISEIGAASGGTGQYGNGINIYRAQNVIVADNIVTDCAFSAIRGNTASGMIARGNQCLRSGETALYAEFGTTGSIIDGNLIDGAANGISVVNFDSGGRLSSVSSNIVRNIVDHGPTAEDAAGFGIGIAVEADTAVAANVVEKAARFGMAAGWGPYLRAVSMTGNVVRESPVGLAVTVAEGAGKAVVTGNTFQAVPQGAIVGYRWTERASDDLAGLSEEAVADLFNHLTIARNSVS